MTHLVLEVLAYALDEAVEGTTRHIDVLACPDGSVRVADDGRGTDTRPDDDGVMRVKPVMATPDLRFFGRSAQTLPDGLTRHGMSVVAALSAWVEHTNVRTGGGWTARYERGFATSAPRTTSGAATGTVVHLRPDPEVFGDECVDLDALTAMVDRIESPAHLVVR